MTDVFLSFSFTQMKSLESDKGWMESKETTEKLMRTLLGHTTDSVYSVDSAACDLGYDRLNTSRVDLEEAGKDLETEKYEVDVSESKKVRLEADNDDLARLSRRLEALDNDNKRLSCELNSIRASKVAAEAKLEALITDKIRLEIELLKEQPKRVFSIDSSMSVEHCDKDMNASVAVVAMDGSSCSRDAATSPEPSRGSSSKAICSYFSHSSYIHKKVAEKVAKMVEQEIFTVVTCNPGDTVLVVWDTVHCNYAIYQESPTLYFLHSDCVDALNMGMNQNSRKCVLAEVIDKEYCHAKKVRLSND